jgi:hypothetical protein
MGQFNTFFVKKLGLIPFKKVVISLQANFETDAGLIKTKINKIQ